MFSTLKKVAMVSVVLSVVNAIGAILVCMFLNPIEDIGFPFRLAIMAFLLTAAVLFVAISFALWSCYNDLMMQADSDYESITSLKKRVDELERKVGM